MTRIRFNTDFFVAAVKEAPVSTDRVLMGDSENNYQLVGVDAYKANAIGSQQQFTASGTAVLLPPSGTIAANGKTTIASALPQVYDMGLWVYLPAGAITSVGGGAAGLYWAVASKNQALQFKNNYFDPIAAQFIPRPPDTVGSNATGSGSAYVSPSNTNITLANITVGAGALGSNGRIDADIHFTQNTGTAARRSMVQINDNDMTRINSSANQTVRHIPFLQNQGVANRQISGAENSQIGGRPELSKRFSLDSTAALALTCKGYLPSADIATAYVILDSLMVEITNS